MNQILLDFSTTYAIHPLAPRRLHYAAPQQKFGMVLRDPTARAWSHYNMVTVVTLIIT